jgi:DNA-binding XRE family transcriptional regulator/predicted RNase H-like HicB family nuclease
VPREEVGRLTEYVAVLSKEGARTSIEFPDCPGCQTFAEPNESVTEVAREALEGWLYAHLVDGEAPPRPTTVTRAARTRAVRISAQLALALQIRWSRQDLELSQSQLGKRLGVSRQQVASLENPDSNWRISTLLRVAEALGLELDVALVRRRATDLPLKAAR